MAGINISETCHVVNLMPPIDNVAGSTSAVVDMRGWSHCSLIIQIGVANADMGDITIEACDDLVPTTSAVMAFNYYAELTAAGDVLDTGPTAVVAATGITHDISNANNTMFVVEINATELPVNYRGFRVIHSAGAVSVMLSMVAILSGGRYKGYGSPTVLS